MNPNTRIPIGDAARLVGRSLDTLKRWVQQGRLRSWRGPGGVRYFDPDEVRALLVAGMPRAAPVVDGPPAVAIATPDESALRATVSSTGRVLGILRMADDSALVAIAHDPDRFEVRRWKHGGRGISPKRTHVVPPSGWWSTAAGCWLSLTEARWLAGILGSYLATRGEGGAS